MLDSLLDLWRSRRAKRHCLATLRPVVDREIRNRQQGEAPDWSAPDRLGFLATAIAHLARRASPGLGSDGLGLVQAETWGALTGLPTDLLGERLLALSLADDACFTSGCAEALAFLERLGPEPAVIVGGEDDPFQHLFRTAREPPDPGGL